MKRTDTVAPWYALHVRPRLEKIVARALEARGYEQYLPISSKGLPIFPGFVFCRFSLLEALSILTVPGVLSIAGVGVGPMPVERHQIESIRRILNAGARAELWRFPEVGQLSTIEGGPIAGVRGILLKSVHRMVVPIPALQRSLAVEMDRDGVKLQRLSENYHVFETHS